MAFWVINNKRKNLPPAVTIEKLVGIKFSPAALTCKMFSTSWAFCTNKNVLKTMIYETNEEHLLSDTKSKVTCVYWGLRDWATNGQHEKLTKRKEEQNVF